jgi:hypothetical protein
MHQIQLETDELRLVIRSLEQHAAANGDELADCEYLIRTLQGELDRETRLERAVDALRELFDYSLFDTGRYHARSVEAFRNAAELLDELREHHE